jgi:chromosome segregation ATPase
MWKKLVVVGLLVSAGVVAARSSSYVGTWVQNLRRQVTGQVPRSFEIDRVRYQISKLDDEIKAKFGPIAEKMAEAEDLSAQVKAGRASLDRQTKQLKALTEQVEAKTDYVVLDTTRLTLSQAKAKMARDFQFFKRTKSSLEQKEKRLNALEQTIAKSKERLDRLHSQKVEFERQLAELELREQELAMEKEATPTRCKDGLVADIQSTLDGIQRSQSVDRAKLDLAREFDGKVTPADINAVPQVTVEEVRRGLDGKTAPEMPKVVQVGSE